MVLMIILGIETSCDETAVSIVEAKGNLLARSSFSEGGGDFGFRVLASAVHSQVKVHEEYGGVVPNLAKREHQKNLPLVLKKALGESGLDLPKIDLIAVTVGPGLEPALWVGIEFAKGLGEKWGIQVIGVNHMEGHIASVLFHKTDEFSIFNFQFPALALLISGGHTELIFLKNWMEKEMIGETKDDAVGEAFDKVARMLGLPYPGGPEINRLAEEAREKNINLETKFPRPMINSKDCNFSFSGLKTAVLYYLRGREKLIIERTSAAKRGQESGMIDFSEFKTKVAREFEDAVIETLISKTKKALAETEAKTLIIGGGVIANKALRENFLKLKENYPGIEILIPEKSLTTDNATMIAAAGYIEYLRGKKPSYELKAQGNLNIS